MVNDIEKNLATARAILDENRNAAPDRVIDLLRGPGAPDHPEVCALLARAYFQRGDTRGDLYSAHFFAHRAVDLGFAENWLHVVAAIASFRKEQYAEAVQVLSAVVEASSPPANQCLYGLALLYAGEESKCMAWLERAVDHQPDNAGFQDALQRARSVLEEGFPVKEIGVPTIPLGLGGFLDKRPDQVRAPYDHNAVSVLRGQGNAPKDFDWLDKNIPCQKACPAGTDIPGYLSAIYRGEYDEAYRINLRDNVFPAVLGRVCSRPCEAECRHGWEGLGEPVAICFSKRSAADFKTQDKVLLDKWFEPSGKKVAVAGAGPAGLAAARDLALYGHQVTVYEKHVRPGGMMNQGIPVFRLPRDLIDKEIDQVRELGVEIVCSTEIGRDISMAQLLAEHDAFVMAAGTLRPNMLNIPGRDLQGIEHGLPYLLEVHEDQEASIGDNVVVIGGGFTAMDCARTARRMGKHAIHLQSDPGGAGWKMTDYPVRVEASRQQEAKGDDPSGRTEHHPVRVSYRRSVHEMLVTPGELEELEVESIPMEFLVSPVAYVGDENGHVKAMRFIKTKLGEPDASGRRRPENITGSEFEVPADLILLATGQFPETDWIDETYRSELVEDDGWLRSGKEQQTPVAGVFTAGDFATGASTLIEAIAHGKQCARDVDHYLMGEVRVVDVAEVEDVVETSRIREMDAVDRQPMPMLDLGRRDLKAEVELGFGEAGSVDETQRCYFCHFKYEIDADKCIYCDWCIKAKPRPKCILKVKSLNMDEDGRITGYEEAARSEDTNLIWINQEDCIRCNACVDACPVDCISIQRVSKRTIRACDSCVGDTRDNAVPVEIKPLLKA